MSWRVGRHFPIHVYEGDRPVATFHDAADATLAVDAFNAAGTTAVADRAAVWLDPGRKGGTPCIYGHRIDVERVAWMTYVDGVDAAKGTWALTRAEVLGGCWYMAVHGSKKWRRRWGDWAKTNARPLWHGNYDDVTDPPTEGATA